MLSIDQRHSLIMESELNSVTSCGDLLSKITKNVDSVYNESIGGVVHFDNADLIPDLIAHNDAIQQQAVDVIDSIKSNSKTDKLKEFLKVYFPNGISKTQLIEILTSEEWAQILAMYDLTSYDYNKDDDLIKYWADKVNLNYIENHPEVLSSMHVSMATEALTADVKIDNMKAWISHAPISSYTSYGRRSSLSC